MPKQKYNDKQEISLLTLLANESTSGARKLLLKHGQKDATSYTDLEKKLADLYFNSPDKKIDLEKEMAAIHPHAKWLNKYNAPKEEVKVEKVEVKEEVKEPKANACGCQSCQRKAIMGDMQLSNADGLNTNTNNANVLQQVNSNTLIAMFGAIGIVAIVALVINKK